MRTLLGYGVELTSESCHRVLKVGESGGRPRQVTGLSHQLQLQCGFYGPRCPEVRHRPPKGMGSLEQCRGVAPLHTCLDGQQPRGTVIQKNLGQLPQELPIATEMLEQRLSGNQNASTGMA